MASLLTSSRSYTHFLALMDRPSLESFFSHLKKRIPLGLNQDGVHGYLPFRSASMTSLGCALFAMDELTTKKNVQKVARGDLFVSFIYGNGSHA